MMDDQGLDEVLGFDFVEERWRVAMLLFARCGVDGAAHKIV
jgi:hypothetical protein